MDFVWFGWNDWAITEITHICAACGERRRQGIVHLGETLTRVLRPDD
jgi:hypothetical protein